MSYTPGPWEWHPEDHSTAMLTGPDGMSDLVMSVSPCRSCIETAEGKKQGWEFGRCTTPKIEDARLIAAAPELLASLKETRDMAALMLRVIAGRKLLDDLGAAELKHAGFGKRADTAIQKAEGGII